MIIISTKQGKLFQDGEFIKSELFQPANKFQVGDLSIEASPQNIHQVSESLLALFIRPQGMQLKNDRKWDYLKMDVVGNGKIVIQVKLNGMKFHNRVVLGIVVLMDSIQMRPLNLLQMRHQMLEWMLVVL